MPLHDDPIPPPVPGSDHAETAAGELDRALALVRFLRTACPWDAEQTARSLVPHLLEETREVVEAVHAGDAEALEGELGDLLLNLAFQIVVAEEDGALTADSVTRRLEDKMRRRHPHLYGLGELEDWETLKARERPEGEGVLDGLVGGLDSLSKAHRMQERVAGVGFDWDDTEGALAKVREEIEEVAAALGGADADALDEELGDLLFAVVNLVRRAGRHPVPALDRANAKFRRRFERLEQIARERGVVWGEATLEELDRIWDGVKEEERG